MQDNLNTCIHNQCTHPIYEVLDIQWLEDATTANLFVYPIISTVDPSVCPALPVGKDGHSSLASVWLLPPACK